MFRPLYLARPTTLSIVLPPTLQKTVSFVAHLAPLS